MFFAIQSNLRKFIREIVNINTNAKYQHTNREINTAKCLFEREIAKYSSAIFSAIR